MKAAEDSILENTARRRKTASGFFFQPPVNRFGFGSGKALNRKGKIRWERGTTRRGQGFSQTFTYDPLNRLTANTLGGAASQSWTLDSQGNQSSVTTNGVTQTETANAQNQITSISGTSATPTYDANGNMTTDQDGNTYVYNAWNQLVSVSNASGQVIAQYTYDARGYRVTETYPQGGNGVAAGTTINIYYDSQWQAIETRTNGTANSNVTSQTVLSASYINAAVLQGTYSAGVIQPNSRLYFEQDANWDTTAIVGFNSTTGTWGVTQRYVYSPYGTITVLNADWSTPPTGTQPLVNNLYQGMALDSVTGLYYARNRNYSPSLGRWINQDPAGYINGANTYQFVMSNPVGNVDPWGLELASQSGPWGVPPGQLPPPTLSGLLQDAQTAAADTWNGLSNFWDGFNNFGIAATNAFGNLINRDPALGMVLPGGEFAPEGKVAGELAEQAAKELKPNVEPKPETKGPARPSPCPKAAERTPEENAVARNYFKNSKKAARQAWEQRTGRKWPADANGEPWPAEHTPSLKNGGDPMNVYPRDPGAPDPHNIPGPDGLTDYQRWGSQGPPARQANK